MKSATARVASSDASVAVIVSVAVTTTTAAVKTLAVTPAMMTTAPVTATVARTLAVTPVAVTAAAVIAVVAAKTLAVVAETCTTLRRSPGTAAPPLTATASGGSSLPMLQVRLPGVSAPLVAATAGGGPPSHTAGKRSSNASLGCSQVISRMYDLRPDGSRMVQLSAEWWLLPLK